MKINYECNYSTKDDKSSYASLLVNSLEVLYLRIQNLYDI